MRQKSIFQKIVTYLMLVIMNISPFMSNLMSARTAMLAGSALSASSVFAGDSFYKFTTPRIVEDIDPDNFISNDEKRRYYGNRGQGFGAGLFNNPSLGSYIPDSNTIEIESGGDVINIDAMDLFDANNNTADIDDTLYSDDKEKAKVSIMNRANELKTENSVQGQAFRMLYGCEVGQDCSSPTISDNTKEQRRRVENLGIFDNTNQIIDGAINNLDSLTADCEAVVSTETSTQTKWIKDIKKCNQNVATPLVGSCKVTREIKEVNPLTNIKHFATAGGVGTSVELVDNMMKFSVGDNAYRGGSCGQFNSRIEFDIDNLNSITQFKLQKILVDDHMAVLVNGTPVYGINGRGGNRQVNNSARALVVPQRHFFKKGVCYSWDDESVYTRDLSRNAAWSYIEHEIVNSHNFSDYGELFKNLQEHSISQCIANNAKTIDVYGESGISYNNSGYHIFYKKEQWSAEPVWDNMSSNVKRVITNHEDAKSYLSYAHPDAYLGKPPYQGESSSYSSQTSCELSRSGNFTENVDLRPYLRQGFNVIDIEVAVGGGGEVGVDLMVTGNNIGDVITEEPAGCMSSPKPGWGAKVVDSAQPQAGSTKRWQCLDLDNAREFQSSPITPTVHGPMLSELFELDNPSENICYEAVARNYVNDLSTLNSSGCLTLADGTQKCYSDEMLNAVNINTCEDKGYVANCNFVSEECVSTDENGSCTSYSKTYDCGKEHIEYSTKQVETYNCPGTLSCIGDQCLSQTIEQNQDFERVVGALSTINQAAKDASTCNDEDWIVDSSRSTYTQAGVEKNYLMRDPAATNCTCDLKDNEIYDPANPNDDHYNENDPDSSRQVIDMNTCSIFKGKAYQCKEVFSGVQDCCSEPPGINLFTIIKTHQLMDTVGAYKKAAETLEGIEALSGVVSGAKKISSSIEGFGDDVTSFLSDAWDDAASAFGKSVGKKVGEQAGQEFAGKSFVDQMQGKLINAVAEWTGSALGGGIQDMLFEKTVDEFTKEAGFKLSGNVTAAFDFINTAMMYYQAITLAIQLLYKCEDSEFEMGYKKATKTCTDTGGYCASKFLGYCYKWVNTACCYDSALGRIISEQAHTQLGLDYGNVKSNPRCDNLTVERLHQLDWDQINLDEYLDILKSASIIPMDGDSADQLLSANNSTKSLNSKIDELQGTNNADDTDTGIKRIEDQMAGVDPNNDDLKTCMYKEFYDLAIDGREGSTCVSDCGDNALWNDQAQACQCVDGTYRDGNGKCSITPQCEDWEEFDTQAGQCIQKCGYQEVLAPDVWSGETTIKDYDQPNVPDTCGGDDRMNPFEGPYTKECLDVDETSYYYGGYFRTGDRRSVFRTRNIIPMQKMVCESPTPTPLSTSECREITNRVERSACLNTCSRLDSPSDQLKCRSMEQNCNFSKSITNLATKTWVEDDRAQCVSDILSGASMPGDVCNAYGDDISRLACSGQCEITKLSMLGAIKCSKLASRCSEIADEEEKKFCIDVLRHSDITYGENNCADIVNENDKALCMERVLPTLKNNILSSWCNTNVPQQEFCQSLYTHPTELQACNLLSTTHSASSQTCSAYIDSNAQTITYTPTQLAQFSTDAQSLTNHINTGENFIVKLVNIGVLDDYGQDYGYKQFEVTNGSVVANLYVLMTDDQMRSDTIHRSYFVLSSRLGKQYDIALSTKAIEALDAY